MLAALDVALVDCNRLPAVSNRACHALFQVAGGQADPEMQLHAHGRSS